MISAIQPFADCDLGLQKLAGDYTHHSLHQGIYQRSDEGESETDTANVFCVLSGHVSQTCNHLHALITIASEVAQAIVLSTVSFRCIETLRALTAVAMYAVHLCYCRFARGQSHLFNFLQRYSEMENRGIGFLLH